MRTPYRAGDAARLKLIGEIAGSDPEIPACRTLKEGIGYLRLPSFTKENNELLREVMRDLPSAAKHERLLIVDLRMNQGGDIPAFALKRWLGKRVDDQKPSFPSTLRKSCLYPALRWGYTQITSAGLKPPISDELRGELQEELNHVWEPSIPVVLFVARRRGLSSS